MKQTKTILLTAVAVLLAFSATIYTSCKKDPCKGVNCQNGGACSNGKCSCPSGYGGNFCELSTLTYTNDTYTPIIITFNGQTSTIPVGSSVSYLGSAGSSVTFSAYTSGTTTSGTQVGLQIQWPSTTDVFPGNGAAGETVIPLDISSDYFFLKIINNSAYSIGKVEVNYDLLSATTNDVTIPNDGSTYNIGYYDAWTNSDLYLLSTGGSVYWSYGSGGAGLGLPFTANQRFTYTAY